MAQKSPTFASLFSGCGGFDLGFMTAGFQPRGAFDIDTNAVEHFKLNVHSNVHEVDLSEDAGSEHFPRDVDAMIAGPPCQGFSTAGKRQLDDVRNSLLTRTGVLAVQLRPKVLVVENVAGALAGAHSKFWNQLDATMRAANYQTHTVHCDAADLGMAQKRKRILFFAWKTGRQIDFSFKEKAAGSLKDALSDVRGIPNHKPRRLARNSREWLIARRIRPGQKLSNVRGGRNAVATWDIPEVFGAVNPQERTLLELLRVLRRQDRRRDQGDADPVSIVRLEAAFGKPFRHLLDSLVSKRYLRRVGDDVDLAGTFNGTFRRLLWQGPSCTVDTRFGSPRYFLHPVYDRGFTVREAARLQGFPDSFAFKGAEGMNYRLIGNAVPPPLAVLAATLTRRLLSDAA